MLRSRALLLACLVLAAGGCTSLRRALGREPEPGPQPVQLPTAAFSGVDRMLTAPGAADGRFERILFPAGDAVAPVGDSAVLLDLTGPGVVRRIRVTLTSADPHWLRRVALAMYWDDEVEPSVHVPIGDFFGNGFARTAYASLPMGVGSDGFYSYLPLPFSRRARIVLENGTGMPVEGLAFEAEVERDARLVEPVATFHALWSRDPRPRPDRRHEVVDVQGAGWFVGTALNAQGHEGSFAFLRGNGVFRVDGSALDSGTVAAYLGTGAAPGADSALAGPLRGVALLDPEKARIAAYRWHLVDPIPFRTSFRLELERGRANRDGAEFSTVAYWYQTEPHPALPPFPGPHERRVPDVLLPPGALRGDQLEVIGTGRGTVRMTVPVLRPDRYEVVVFAEASPGAVSPRFSVSGSARPGLAVEVSPQGAEPGDVLPGVVIDTVAVTARTLDLQLDAQGSGIALPAAVQLRPVAGWAGQWWGIGGWPTLGGGDASEALRYRWGPDQQPEVDRTHELPDGRMVTWGQLDGAPDGRVELAPLGGTAYAQAFLYSPRERAVVLVLESEGAREVAVADAPALERAPRAGTDEVELDAYLRSGWNRVVVKLAAVGTPGRFRLRAADPAGELVWARSPS